MIADSLPTQLVSLRLMSLETVKWLVQKGIDINPTFQDFRQSAEVFGRCPEPLAWLVARWDMDTDRKTLGGRTLVDVVKESMIADIEENLTAPILKRFERKATAALQPQVWKEKEVELMFPNIAGVELPEDLARTILQFVRLPARQ